MPRTAAEIKDEIATLKGQGVHQATKQMRGLRAELKALESPVANKGVTETVTESDATSWIPTPQAEVSVEVDAGPGPVPVDSSQRGGTVTQAPAPNIFETPEWLFLEKCAFALELDLTKGMTSSQAKKVYNQIVAKFMAWATFREIMEEHGDQILATHTFPTYDKLGRDLEDGRKLPPEPEVSSNGAEEALPAPAEPVSAPVHPVEAIAALRGKNDLEALAGAMRGDMESQISGRTEKPKPPIPMP